MTPRLRGLTICRRYSNYPVNRMKRHIAALAALWASSLVHAEQTPLFMGQVELALQPGIERARVSPQHWQTQIGLILDSRGKVAGYVDRQGCELEGRWEETILNRETLVSLDLRVSNCADAAFNGRYGGKIDFYQKGRASLSLAGVKRAGIGRYDTFTMSGYLASK